MTDDRGGVAVAGPLGRLDLSELLAPGANASILWRSLPLKPSSDTKSGRGPSSETKIRQAVAKAIEGTGKLQAEALGRRRKAVASLVASGWRASEGRVVARWRLLVGNDASNHLESSMSLHGTYGLPVLPASGLKGVARAWAEQEGHDPSVFGSPDTAARVTVTDAIPKTISVELDVLTPHAGPYYQTQGNAEPEPPAEWYEPTPVDFLVVAPGADFVVHLFSRDEDDLGSAKRFLERALDDLGLGAKTAAGYGYCDVTWSAIGEGRDE